MEVQICCLPIEVKARDLDARLYLGLKLARQGYGVLIGRKSHVHRLMLNSGTGFLYFTKGVLYERVPFLDEIRAKNGVVCYLDEEGAFYKDWNLFHDRNHPEVLSRVGSYFSWGEKQRDLLLAAQPHLLPEDYIVTGHPRFDLRKRTFASLYRKTVPRDLFPDKPYFLINTNFVYANNLVAHLDELRSYERKAGRKVDVALLRRFQNYHEQLLDRFIDLARLLAEQFPDRIVVVRPHPVERIETYQKRLGDIRNVWITSQGTAHAWIVGSDLIIHHDCTTAVEARLFGTPTVSYQPLQERELTAEIPLAFSESATSSKELVDFARRHAGNGHPRNLPLTSDEQGVLKPYVANTDFSSTREIVQLVTEKYGRPSRPATFSSLPLGVRHSRPKRFSPFKYLRASSSPRQWWGRKRRRSSESAIEERGRKKFPSLKKSELTNMIGLIRRIQNNIPEIRVQQVSEDTFYIVASND